MEYWGMTTLVGEKYLRSLEVELYWRATFEQGGKYLMVC
jgi:hypothetical protein